MSVMTTARDRIRDLVSESVYDNPVVTREFRTRMRGWKAFMVMGGYSLLLAGIMFIAYVVMWNSHTGPGGSLTLTDRNVGMDLFLWLAWTQAILLTLIIPSLTFSSITQELERKTIELLALTRLTPGKIVLGKQLAGFVYALILLICSVPLASMCLMFGGISPGEIALWYVVLVAWCFLLTSAGVFWSSLFAKTAGAALFGYGTAMGYFLVTLAYGGMMTAYSHYSGSSREFHVLGALNPGWAAYSASSASTVCGLKFSPSLAALLVHGGIGALLLLVASTHVRHQRAERALSIRIMLMAVTAMLVWFFVGNMQSVGGFAHTSGSLLDLLSVLASVILAVVMLLTCSIATGEVKAAPKQSVFSYALSLRRLFRSDIGGAIPFTMIWTMATYAALGVTIRWAAAAQKVKLPPELWPAYWRVGVSLVAITMATAAIGVLGSCIVRQRKNAAALVLLFLIVAFSGYGIVMAYYVPGAKPGALIWQLAAFWPMTSVMSSTGNWNGMPDLWWHSKHSWLVCSLAYAGIAALALALATRPLKAFGGVMEE